MPARCATLVALVAVCCAPAPAHAAPAPAPRAFANPDVPTERRIDDLLAALTLDEKIECLASRPKLPRLGLRLTGQVEGLHGLALGDGSGWGRNQPVPTVHDVLGDLAARGAAILQMMPPDAATA